MPSVPIPTIVERTSRGERSWDIFSRLLKERVILIGEPIDDELASSVVAQLLVLQQQDPERDIWMYINSPGGVIRAGLAIYDTMQLVTPDVCTVCVGRAASMATVLLCAGTKGKRFALPHATIHSHPGRWWRRGLCSRCPDCCRRDVAAPAVAAGNYGRAFWTAG